MASPTCRIFPTQQKNSPSFLKQACALSCLPRPGFSFGGIVAGHLAAILGDRVSNLILIGPNGISLTPGRTGPIRMIESGMDWEAVVFLLLHHPPRFMLFHSAAAQSPPEQLYL